MMAVILGTEVRPNKIEVKLISLSFTDKVAEVGGKCLDVTM